MKKKFIIDVANYDKNRLGSQVERILKLCKIDPKGRVLINVKGMTQKDKLKLVLVARFLANKLDEKIDSKVSNSELSYILNAPIYQARARASEIVREGFAISDTKGTFSVVPYRIDDFLEYAEVFVQREETKS